MPSTIETIIQEQTSESLHLEFKRSVLLKDRRKDDICKAVSALANSDGGRIFFGIAEDKETLKSSLDNGIIDAPRTIEWLDNILSDNIAPRISEVEISYEEVDGAQYVFLDVPRSPNAPHQSSDKRFYKRSNNRSFPMEAYEIEDVRNRRLAGPPPLVIGLELDRGVLAHLSIFNRSEFICRDLKVEVSSNFKMSAFKNEKKGEVSLSRVGIGQRIEYMLGSVYEIIGETADAAFQIEGTYFSEWSANPFQFSDTISVGELEHSIVPHDIYGAHLKKIGEELRSTHDEIKKATSVNKEILETIGGAGIRISPLSIFHLNKLDVESQFTSFKYDAYGLTLQGMAEVLEVTTDVVSELHQCLQYIGGRRDVGKALEKLPAEVVDRVRQRINLDRY